ncbi:NAD-dependent epimerase/dehydratase family protein [Lentzea rhizosphaerae]|uniref:NAD-dependent epimerase/dehydratase family protein n=1 Tax=Lentzea rhizosphaerae TaxID=2041025 RepID=A0ABV8BNN3_9PSEU
MRVLVTGAAGFIGSHFTRHWLSEHPSDEVIALDALTYRGTRANLPSGVPFVHADIAEADVEGVDVVVNFAAESHNSLAVLDPARFFRTNVLGTQALLEACRRAGVRRFHHVSTCEVYGDLALDAVDAFHEESPHP